ncbi:MAG: mechanosensitive ion channel [Schleiferiaceae bacterium]|nr:mechanosensitive ion channel [Schleiferiaceae bacterium]
MTMKDLLDFVILSYGSVSITVFNLLEVFFILTLARTFTFLIRQAFNRAVRQRRVDRGTAYALRQLVNYVIWIITILFTLDFSGVEVTVILAYSTALFVGLGLGLQDTFKDFISGIILLTERSVTAGDIIEIDGLVGKVKEVGLRTTKVMSRDDIAVILPNSQLTNQGVINWSHQHAATRFHVEVGVAYGTDTRMVEKVLLECMASMADVDDDPEPSVQFRDFGDNSLMFRANFHSSNLFRIEFTKSELRFAIDAAFRKNNITIAFPQMDVWIRNQPTS